MTDKSFKKFIKLMMMTTSSHDGEALNALRMANAMMAEKNLNWEQVLKNRVPGAPATAPTPAPNTDDYGIDEDEEIDLMFSALLNGDVSPSFRKFVVSVYDWWLKKGHLTDAQYDAIRRAYNRL